jgi:hypothetical protein
MRILIPVLLLLALGGCVRTAASIVTFPVKAASQGVDWATTSQDEADRNYGRKMRKQEARQAREERKRKKQEEKRFRELQEDRAY